MKKWISIAVIGILSHNGVFAQIENISFGEELVFEKIYAGLDSQMILPNDTLAIIPYTTFRLGTAVSWHITDNLSFYSHGALQWSNSHPTFSITAFVLNYQLSDKVKIGVGLPPTATTFTRAHPISWRNQSESYAQSRIIGNQLGAILQYEVTEDLRLAYSFQKNNGTNWANHLNVNYKNIQLAGYIQDDSEYFISGRLDNGRVDANYNYSSFLKEHAASLFYNVNEKYTIYGDLNYRANSKESDIARLGLRRYFRNEKNPVGAFISISYDFQLEQTQFRLFLHLN